MGMGSLSKQIKRKTIIAMEKPIVTVIMPVYNEEEYVCRAIESICAQTLTDWELIIVDDGSTDRSGSICDEQAASDERIKVIHQENQGIAAARNAAIDKASGKYLCFMDADDWTVSSMLYEMVSLAENYFLDAWAGRPVNNVGRDISSIGKPFPSASEYKAIVPDDKCAQLVIAGYYKETYYTDIEYHIQKQSIPSVVYGSNMEFREHAHQLLDRNLLDTTWNKLYLTSYIKDNDIRFTAAHGENLSFNLEVIKHIERITVTDNAYYHFICRRSESVEYNPALLEQKEEENKCLIGIYDGWRAEVQQKIMNQMLAEGNAPMLVTTKQTQGQPEGSSSDACKAETDQKPVSAAENPSDTKSADSTGAQPADNPENQSTDAADSQTSVQEADNKTAVSFNFLGDNPTEVPIINIPSAEAEEVISRRYLEDIVECIENITNPKCTLTDTQIKDEIKKIITRDSVREALKKARPRSVYTKLMLVPIRLKAKNLTYAEGRFISNIKSKDIKKLTKLKKNRQ